MLTEYLRINANAPEEEIIEVAAAMLKKGEIVAFPTETVYGLGALVWDAKGVEKIFIAKGRPPENPLLVHVSNLDQVRGLVPSIPDVALRLMERFWPGPLSLILPSRPEVPGIVRANQPGVGLRMPDHPVALALINKTGPIAAPSANKYGRPSPLTAEHVKADLNGEIAAILDAGPTGLGIESTILDLSATPARLLRQGGVEFEELVEFLDSELEIIKPAHVESRSYTSPLKIILAQDRHELEQIWEANQNSAIKIALVNNSRYSMAEMSSAITYFLDLDSKSSNFFSILRDAEGREIDVLIFAPIPEDVKGLAGSIRDRVIRAANR